MLNAITPEQKLEQLFFEMCEREETLCTQRRYATWMRSGRKLMANAPGKTVKVRMRDSNSKRKVFVTGTIKSIAPARLDHHRRSVQVVWRVTLTSGRIVHLTRV